MRYGLSLLSSLFILCTSALYGRNDLVPLPDLWEKELIKKIEKAKPPAWMMEQIENDLKPYARTGISLKMLDETMEGEKRGEDRRFVRYSIRGKKVTSRANRPHVSKDLRYQVMTALFEQLASSLDLPDLDFVVCLWDMADGQTNLPGPIFAFAKDISSDNVVLIPDFDSVMMSQKCLREVTKGQRKYPWHKKIGRAFWRGAMTGGEFTEENFLTFPRTLAVTASLTHPLQVNARFTAVTQCADPKKIETLFASYFGRPISVIEHLKYKYQLLIDGNSCAYLRAYWQLFSNSLLFKQESRNIQWYYAGLEPYVHYVPVAHDMSNLVEQVEWALSHDEEAQSMAKNASNFAQSRLKLEDMYYYYYLLLTEYHRRCL